MAIKKQEFYEGAALHQLVTNADGIALSYQAPFFIVNKTLLLYLKYSTAVRSPWGFTFTAEEQRLLFEESNREIVLGLICGSDGIVRLPLDQYFQIAPFKENASWVSCYRNHREHYEVTGPKGKVSGKIPPSDWYRLLKNITRDL